VAAVGRAAAAGPVPVGAKGVGEAQQAPNLLVPGTAGDGSEVAPSPVSASAAVGTAVGTDDDGMLLDTVPLAGDGSDVAPSSRLASTVVGTAEGVKSSQLGEVPTSSSVEPIDSSMGQSRQQLLGEQLDFAAWQSRLSAAVPRAARRSVSELTCCGGSITNEQRRLRRERDVSLSRLSSADRAPQVGSSSHEGRKVENKGGNSGRGRTRSPDHRRRQYDGQRWGGGGSWWAGGWHGGGGSSWRL
jgi:hypothetical protein